MISSLAIPRRRRIGPVLDATVVPWYPPLLGGCVENTSLDPPRSSILDRCRTTATSAATRRFGGIFFDSQRFLWWDRLRNTRKYVTMKAEMSLADNARTFQELLPHQAQLPACRRRWAMKPQWRMRRRLWAPGRV